MTEKKKSIGLDEIASRIGAHLHRFEADPRINAIRPGFGVRRYYGAGAWRAGSFVRVVYISYQEGSNLRRDDAERYLGMLDDGFVGRHHEALRDRGER